MAYKDKLKSRKVNWYNLFSLANIYLACYYHAYDVYVNIQYIVYMYAICTIEYSMCVT